MNADEINWLLQTTEDPKTAKRLFNELTTEAVMQGKQPAYFTAYRSVKLTRDTWGVLVLEFHSNGGPLTFTASDHTDFVDAFYRISQDRENKIVILTGTGGEFIPAIEFSSFGNVADPAVPGRSRFRQGPAAMTMSRSFLPTMGPE